MFLYHVVKFKMLFLCVLREPCYSSVRWAFCPVYECRGELTHLKRPWCWERLKVGGEGNDRGWDGWMASWTQWMWVWVNSGSWWWTGRPDMLQSMGSQRVRHDWVTELNWTWCEKVVQFDYFAYSDPVFPTFTKETVFSHYMLLPLLFRLTDLVSMGSFLGFLFFSIDFCVCFYANIYCFDYYSFFNIVWNQGDLYHPSFSRLFWLFRVFCASIPIFELFVLVLWKISLAFR